MEKFCGLHQVFLQCRKRGLELETALWITYWVFVQCIARED